MRQSNEFNAGMFDCSMGLARECSVVLEVQVWPGSQWVGLTNRLNAVGKMCHVGQMCHCPACVCM